MVRVSSSVTVGGVGVAALNEDKMGEVLSLCTWG